MPAAPLLPFPRRWLGFAAALICLAAHAPARAADCPGNPDALGTSRTLVVDPAAHPLIGSMQYRETLPLADNEVVLTFDDGPLPKYSNQILEILARDCVQATFFVIGRMAKAYPEGVRKYAAAGHSVGTHTENHPLSMHKMPIDRARQEIEDAIAHTSAALGDTAPPAPFFRIPGLLRADAVEAFARSRGLQVWSADFPADDWRSISADTVHRLAMSRLAAKGKGILLLHDIQPRTVAALPMILRDLKAGGYRIVHVVPATAERPATPSEPRDWLAHPQPDAVAAAPATAWPAVPGFAFARSEALPAPDGALMLRPEPPGRSKRLARGARWPDVALAEAAAASLPVPAPGLYGLPEPERVPPTPRQATLAARALAERPSAPTIVPKAAAPAAAAVAPTPPHVEQKAEQKAEAKRDATPDAAALPGVEPKSVARHGAADDDIGALIEANAGPRRLPGSPPVAPTALQARR